MQPKPVILTPSIAQIEQLRADFFKRLDAEGAPCEGIFVYKNGVCFILFNFFFFILLKQITAIRISNEWQVNISVDSFT